MTVSKIYSIGKMFFNDPAIFDSKSLKYVHEHYQLLFELVNDDMIYIGIYYP